MNVVVIGGAGYIGSHVVRALLRSGHRVRVFDNLSTGLPVNILPAAPLTVGDILDAAALDEVFGTSAVDAVVHLAAFKAAGESMVNPEKYSHNNLSGTINIVNAMCRHGIKNLVFSSSAAVYGEPRYLPIDEQHPTDPANYYGFTKLEIERILAWYDRLKGLRSASLRYFNAAGYGDDVPGLEQNPANLLPIIMEVAVGMRPTLQVFGDDYPTADGTCIRDYVHVDDLATAHVSALEYCAQRDASLTVNLGSGVGISVSEMVAVARRITGRPIPSVVGPRRPGDPAELVATADRAAQLLGWKATRSDVESLVASTWAAYNRKEA